ncbi:MAG: polysaccharide pyruvyl transferase family protein [Elusimicrobiales bacterium]|nr:polysaccharide pyruvyl transferase family protein [Elusimicrobiales bacterium]
MKYKFLTVFDTDSATDGVIFRGIENLFKIVFKEFEFKSVIRTENLKIRDEFIRIARFDEFDEKELVEDRFYPQEVFDAVVVPGTPWIWDQFHKSVKYKNLIKMIEMHRYAPVIFLGIGSCVSKGNEESIMREEEKKEINYLFSKGTVVCRDSLAYSALSNADVEANFLPCPSYFAYDEEEFKNHFDRQDLSFVYFDPYDSISSISWKNKEEDYKRFCEIVENIKKKDNVKIYSAINSSDKKIVDKYSKFVLLKNSSDTINLIKNSKKLISVRVHCTAAAYSNGVDSAVIPIDSRARTLTDFGCFEINNLEDLEYFFREYRNKFDKNLLSFYKREYLKILNKLKSEIDIRNKVLCRN